MPVARCQWHQCPRLRPLAPLHVDVPVCVCVCVWWCGPCNVAVALLGLVLVYESRSKRTNPNKVCVGLVASGFVHNPLHNLSATYGHTVCETYIRQPSNEPQKANKAIGLSAVLHPLNIDHVLMPSGRLPMEVSGLKRPAIAATHNRDRHNTRTKAKTQRSTTQHVGRVHGSRGGGV